MPPPHFRSLRMRDAGIITGTKLYDSDTVYKGINCITKRKSINSLIHYSHFSSLIFSRHSFFRRILCNSVHPGRRSQKTVLFMVTRVKTSNPNYILYNSDPSVFQPVASRYTDCAISAPDSKTQTAIDCFKTESFAEPRISGSIHPHHHTS
jgi:hypothetical protein